MCITIVLYRVHTVWTVRAISIKFWGGQGKSGNVREVFSRKWKVRESQRKILNIFIEKISEAPFPRTFNVSHQNLMFCLTLITICVRCHFQHQDNSCMSWCIVADAKKRGGQGDLYLSQWLNEVVYRSGLNCVTDPVNQSDWLWSVRICRHLSCFAIF